MKYFLITGFLFFLLIACSTKTSKHEPDDALSVQEQDSVLTSIAAYIFTPPPYVLPADRLKREYRPYYVSQLPKFSLQKYVVVENGTSYFLVYRPGPTPTTHRAVGGHFKLGNDYGLTGFREVFVTRLLPDSLIKTRGNFLFDEMVKGTVDPYLKMKTYVQWPNEVSEYDSITYEWTPVPDFTIRD